MKSRPSILAILIGFIVAFAVAPPAGAETPQSPQEQSDLAQIETYLNGLTTADANFTFVQSDGAISRGVFYLSRPSKLRFEYTEPAGNVLVADGDYVIFWDAKQKEASNAPLGSTPLAFLLQPHISLTQGVRITAYEHAAGIIRVTLVQAKNPEAGSVTVAFADQPIELRSWHLNAPNQTTDVTFSNWKLGVPLDAGLFRFQDPNAGKRRR